MATPLSRGAAVSIRGCAAATSHASSAAGRLWTRRRAIKWLGAKVCGVRVLQIADAFDKSAMRRSTTLAMFDGKSTHCGCILFYKKMRESKKCSAARPLRFSSQHLLQCSSHRRHAHGIEPNISIGDRHAHGDRHASWSTLSPLSLLRTPLSDALQRHELVWFGGL